MEGQLNQLLVVFIPIIVGALRKTILKSINSSWIPILISLLGAGVGATNGFLSTDYSTTNITAEVINAVILSWSGVGVHQVFKKGKGIVNNGRQGTPGG